jgi:hypothetical protein
MVAKKRSAAKSKSTSKLNAITLTNNELRIRYENSQDLMNKLFHVTQHVANLHASQPSVTAGAVRANVLARFSPASIPSALGTVNATAIVIGCAGNNNGNTKLGDIPGLDLRIFQNCVQSGVIAAGFDPGAIPASPSTTLDDVISAIASATSH